MSYDFSYFPPADLKSADDFVPQIRLDFSENAEPLNRTFGECLVKYVDILGRKGCNRTALEFCKLVLAIDPTNDTFGTLLRIDYYAIRAKEFQFLCDFVEQFAREIYYDKDNALHSSVLILPNLLLTTALAKYNLQE